MPVTGSPPRGWGRLPSGAPVAAALVFAAMCVGAWLRVSLAAQSGLWRDEVQGLLVSTLPDLRGMVAFLAREESHPPLFYLIERAWVGLFGSADGTLILLGLIPGIGTIPLAAAAGWATAGRRAGVLAAWFTALSWPLVQQSGDARPYALLAALALGAAWAGFRSAAGGGRAAWISYVLACTGLLYLHHWSLLVVAGLSILTLTASRSGARAGGGRLRVPGPWLAAHGALALLYAPWAPVLLRQSRGGGYAPAAGFPTEWFVVSPTVLLGVTVALLLPALLVLVVGTVGGGNQPPEAGAARFLGWAAALPCLLAAGAWKFSLLTVTHCLVILAAVALTAVAVALGGQADSGAEWRRRIAGGCLIVLLGVSLATRWFPKSNLREAASLVSSGAGRDDLIILHTGMLGPVFRRYAAPGLGDVLTFPPQAENGPVRFRDWGEHLEGAKALDYLRDRVEVVGREGAGLWIVSEVREAGTADSTAPSRSRQRLAHLTAKSLDDIRAIAVGVLGPPEIVFGPDRGTRTRERIRLERFRPRREGP